MITYVRLKTCIGDISVLYADGVISHTMYGSTHIKEAVERPLSYDLIRLQRGDTDAFSLLDTALSKCSPFAISVLSEVYGIPAGTTISYSELANRINRPLAVRAVAHAVAMNPVPVLIPCHRVIRKTGSIGKYIWGEERKVSMLQYESTKQEDIEEVASVGISPFTEDPSTIVSDRHVL